MMTFCDVNGSLFLIFNSLLFILDHGVLLQIRGRGWYQKSTSETLADKRKAVPSGDLLARELIAAPSM